METVIVAALTLATSEDRHRIRGDDVARICRRSVLVVPTEQSGSVLVAASGAARHPIVVDEVTASVDPLLCNAAELYRIGIE